MIIKWSLLFYNGYVLLYYIIMKMYLLLYNGDKTRHVRAITFLKETFVSYTRSQPKPQFSFVEKVGVSEELSLGFSKP